MNRRFTRIISRKFTGNCTRRLIQAFVLLVLSVTAPAMNVFAATMTDESIVVDGQQRRFLVHDFSAINKAPTIIILHGGGGNGQNAATQTDFDDLARPQQLITVYPYGNGRLGDSLLTWNAGHCCAYAMDQNIDDIQFISKLIDYLIARHNVDATRIYVTGLSNGGMMTHRIGFELGDKVAAIAPVISGVFGDEPVRNEVAVPTLIINGADDQTVRINGGELGGIGGQLGGAEAALKPIAEQGEYWAKVNGCGPSVMTTADAYQKFTYACADNKSVERYLVTGNGHAWPGGTAPRADADQPVKTFNANEVIWNFFKRFKREPVPTSSLKPYYFDGTLTLPLVATPANQYRAQLQLIRAIPPMEFEVKRAEVVPVQSTVLVPLTFTNGSLQIPELRAGAKRYSAALSVIKAVPLQLRVDTLTALP